MTQTWLEKWAHRISGAWDVLTGKAWAGYGDPLACIAEMVRAAQQAQPSEKPQDDRL